MKCKVNTLLSWLLLIVLNIVICLNTAEAASPESDFAFDPVSGVITRYLGTEDKVEVPSMIDGKPVKGIGHYAFKDCTSLASVTIPEGVTSIEDWAFENCISLTDVAMPEGITHLGIGAFRNCALLVDISIPEDVNFIGEWAFEGCSSLCSIKIPENMRVIEAGMFKNCTALNEVVMPDDLNSIGRWAFEGCTSLTGICLPEGISILQAGIFKNCTALTKVIIPENVTCIEGWAFEDCTSLADITIPQKVTSIDSGAFFNCISLTNIAIPESVTSIGDLAFYSCSSLSAAHFDGKTPTNFGSFVFDLTAPEFTIYAKYGSGFTEPSWNGYRCVLSKSVTIDAIINTVKQAIADGTLRGNGNAKDNKAETFLKKLEGVKPKITQGEISAAINNLQIIYNFVDGKQSPQDLVVGEATEKVASMILELIKQLESDI